MICPHDDSEQIVKHMAVEVDRSVQLHSKIYELKDISKRRLQREKDWAKAAVEEVEKRAIERDDQWKKHLAETRVEMERRIEDWDQEWENHLKSRLCKQAEWHEVSQVQMEHMVKDSANTELRQLEEQVATMWVRQISWYLNCCLHQTQWRTPGGTKHEEQVRQW